MADTLNERPIAPRHPIAESLAFSRRWEARGFDPALARGFPFRLDVGVDGAISVSVHDRDIPIDAGDIRRRFGEAGAVLHPDAHLLLTPGLAGDLVDEALSRTEKAQTRSDWEMATLRLRLNGASLRNESPIRGAIASVERTIVGLRRHRVALTAARAEIERVGHLTDAA